MIDDDIEHAELGREHDGAANGSDADAGSLRDLRDSELAQVGFAAEKDDCQHDRLRRRE